MVIQLLWLANTGKLLSLCSDDTVYLWEVRRPTFEQSRNTSWQVKKSSVEMLQQLHFNRERLSTMSTAVKSKWLFVGTEKGNTHILNLDHFSLSGYIINWNKAIGVHQSSHPGPVSYLLGKHLCSIFLSVFGIPCMSCTLPWMNATSHWIV